MVSRWWIALAFLALGGLPGPGFAGDLLPRRPLPSGPLLLVDGYEQRLVVKLGDDILARATPAGGVTSRSGRDLSAVAAVAAAHALRFSPLIHRPESRLRDLEERAARRSGRAQPDLAGMLVVDLPDPSPGNLLAAGRALDRLEAVEWVHLQTLGVEPPSDIPPATDDLVPGQAFLRGNPGVNSDFAWGWGASGQGVRISDCEYGWTATHEDLNEINLHPEPGQTIHPDVYANGWEQHGTAVAGVLVGMVNGYGCNGMSPDSPIFTYPEWTVEEGNRRVTCITNALASSSPGDVVLLEMQTIGAGGGFGPAELDLAVWTVVKTGTDAGVIVVGAAGNGTQDLDGPAYASYLARGDSGAILVGAGSAWFDHSRLSFSTYGSRVNVQAWGASVQTLGYGDIAFNGPDADQFYTAGFGGTSSASSIVAPACALIQSFQLQVNGIPLSPAEMRQLLIDTGWPQQGGGGDIGPAVNIKKALNTQFPGVAAPRFPSPAAPATLSSDPNPFRFRTVIRFEVPEPAPVRLDVLDVTGRRVRGLLRESRPAAGLYEIPWDGRDGSGRRLPAGVYFLRLEVGGQRAAQHSVLVN